MRVRREWFFDVVPELYRSIKYDEGEASVGSVRAHIYAASMIHLDARIESPSPVRLLSRPSRSRIWCRAWPSPMVYRPEHIEKAVICLLDYFPHLRSIIFGYLPGIDSLDNDETWTVTLDVPSVTFILSCAEISGRIDYVYTLRLDCPPPTSLQTFESPPNFPLRTRFNLAPQGATLTRGLPLPSCPSISGEWGSWSTALQEKAYLKDIHHLLDLHRTQATLRDIGRLFERQAEAGHGETDRLQIIRAVCTLQWGVTTFSKFAKLAGSSLVKLDLGDDHTSAAVSAIDLATLMTTVRSQLTSLRQLSFTMENPLITIFDGSHKRSYTTERACLPYLTESILDDGGSLEELRIGISNSLPLGDLFNAVRCVSPACKATALVNIGPLSSGLGRSQSAYLHYLRSQSPTRKKHLAVVDFAPLDIGALEYVCLLEYDTHDRPISLSSWRSANWVERLIAIDQHALAAGTHSPISRLLLEHFTSTAERLRSISKLGTPREVLGGTRALLECARAWKEGVGNCELFWGCGDMIGEIQELINSLEGIRVWPGA